MTLAIIDYGSGNIRSVAKAFEHVADGKEILVTSRAKDLAEASHIVLPGVGAFADCMKGLSALPGMLDALEEEVREGQKNFLGICVGMQLMFELGREHGEHAGLGWLPGEVVKLGGGWQVASGKKDDALTAHHSSLTTLKIPHMGWNSLSMRSGHPVFKGMANGEHVYFVHSYHAIAQSTDVVATTEYGGDVVAAVARGNMAGVQFHPEKSQKAGLAILKNFLSM